MMMIIAIMVTIREFFTVLGCLGQSGKCSTLLVRGSREDHPQRATREESYEKYENRLGGGGGKGVKAPAQAQQRG